MIAVKFRGIIVGRGRRSHVISCFQREQLRSSVVENHLVVRAVHLRVVVVVRTPSVMLLIVLTYIRSGDRRRVVVRIR